MRTIAALALVAILLWALGTRAFGYKVGEKIPVFFAIIVGILEVARFVDRLMLEPWRQMRP